MGAPWTDGPWTVEDRPRDRSTVNIIANGTFIAVSRDVDAARLIAAAPDLAEALECVLQTIDAQYRAGLRWDPETIEAARAALSKARGETE